MNKFEEFVAKAGPVHEGKYTYLSIGTGKRRKIVYQCSTHGVKEQDATAHLRGAGCVDCSYELRAANKKLTLEQAIKRIGSKHNNKYSYLRIGTNSANKSTVVYVCNKHGEQEQSLNDHANGHSCCGYDTLKVSNSDRYEDYLAKAIKIHGNKYTYKPSDIEGYFLITCPTHGEFHKRFTSHVHSEEGCKNCAYEAFGKSIRYDFEDYCSRASTAHNNRYTYTELIYGKGRTLIRAVCREHGEFIQNAKDHLSKLTNCPKCSNSGVSAPSIELSEYLSQFGLVESEYRVEGCRLRWDIKYSNTLIEYDGLYWHSSQHKSNAYHSEKRRLAESSGFSQINIFSDEWTNKKALVKRLLLNRLGLSTESTVYARNTVVCIVDSKKASEFLDLYHIQGYKKSSHYVGLVYSGEVIAIIGYEMRESGRGKTTSSSHMEITRYTTSCSVPGGFSKLLSFLIKNSPDLVEVYTFSDKRLFSGTLYERCGFKKVATVRPSYFYTDGVSRYDKSSYQKSKLATMTNKVGTEEEMAASLGLYRVYDCGKVKWSKRISK